MANYIGKNTEIVLPDSYNGESYKIGNNAFLGCYELRKVLIPNGSAEIGNYTFKGCSKLELINVNFGIDKLGTGAFENCIKLGTINLSENITTINAFVSNSLSKCYIEEIVITSSVTTIQSLFKR